MRSVKLYGHLGKKFGREFQLEVNSPAEAFRALRANFAGFDAYMHQHRKSGFRVYVGNRNADEQDLFLSSKVDSIRIVPVVGGSSSGAGRIIFGAVIIAAALTPGGQGVAAYLATGGMTAASITTAIVGIGVSMVLGGVVQLLVGTPKTSTVDNGASYMFNGAVNTTQQGNPVPICYGTMIIGSQVVSSGLTVEQNYVPPDDGKTGTSTAYQATPWDGSLRTLIQNAAGAAQ